LSEHHRFEALILPHLDAAYNLARLAHPRSARCRGHRSGRLRARAQVRRHTIGRRPVATLVYRYRQHTIDVFVRPEATSAPALRSVRGFHVMHARGSSMDWLAVSDAEPDALGALVQHLAREDAP
jgi:hypothetical protein